MPAPMPSARRPLLELRAISRRYHGVHALRGVDVTVRAGTIHAWVGENGAGKSTLGKIAAGAVAPSEGTILLDGAPVRFGGPRDALAHGIAAVQQEIALVPALSAAENVFLGLERRQWSHRARVELHRRYRALAARHECLIPPEAIVGRLSLADQQQVEILRAIAREARVIIFDEPTSSLTADQAERLHVSLRRLAAAGAAVVYISHFLKHVLAVTDEVTILRDGRVVRSGPTAAETEESLIEGMIGRAPAQIFPAKAAARGKPVLEVRDLVNPPRLRGVSFTLHRGEVLGLGGLVGSGRSEVARALFGADRGCRGTIVIDGREVAIRRPSDAIRHGVALIPESRKEEGLHLRHSVARNVTLASLGDYDRGAWLRRARERRAVPDLLAHVGVDVTRAGSAVQDLSGGNQQKVLFGKWLATRPKVLIADEPTRGVDVGAKQAIYGLLTALVEQGAGVLLISSELEELLGLSHRVLVLREGAVVSELAGARLTQSSIMGAAFGVAEREAA